MPPVPDPAPYSGPETNSGPPMERGGHCLWTVDEDFHVGIIGSGPGFYSVLDIMANEHYQEYLPAMVLTAAAELGPDEHKARLINAKSVPIYGSALAMLKAHPEITLLIELKGHGFDRKALLAHLPPNVSLIDHEAVVFLCGLHSMLQAGAYCRLTLDRQQELLRAIIDEVREDILLLDKDYRVRDVNRNVAERAGKTKEEMFGHFCWEVQSMGTRMPFCGGPDPNCPFKATLETGKKAEAMLSRVNREGRLQYFRVYTYPVCTPQGEMTHVLVMRRDITMRTHKERERHQREKLALVGEMSTYLAHEIRNPLFAIGGFANSLLRSPNLGNEEREKVSIILDETKRLDHMLTSVLNFSRPTSTEVGTMAVNETVRQTVELMRVGYCRQGFSLEFEPGKYVPDARGEPELFKQCLVNIIKNSVEAMESGGVIRVSTGMEGHMVMVRIQDQGKGMSETEMDKVFSPFYTTKEQGYGLGLAMIKKIVEEFQGHVEMTSQEGQGTTVTILLEPVLAGGVEGGPVDEAPEITTI